MISPRRRSRAGIQVPLDANWCETFFPLTHQLQPSVALRVFDGQTTIFKNIHKHFFDQSELSKPQNLTRLEEKLQELKLALESQKSEKLNRRKRAPSSDGLFYGHDLGITQLHEFGKKVVTTN